MLLVLTLSWPAWISIAASSVAYQLGISAQWAPLIGVVGLLALLPAWSNKRYYNTLETIAKVGLGFVFASVLMVLGYIIWQGDFVTRFDTQFVVRAEDWSLLYAAVAYGGVAGILNFTQASWAKSKGYAGSKKVVDYTKQESQQNFKQWMSFIAKENFVLFWVGNFVGILAIALVTVNILAQTQVTGFQLIIEQFIALAQINPVLELLWMLGVMSLFIMAQLTILDAAGRLWTTITHPQEERAKDATRVFVWIGIAILLISLIVPAFRQPAFLLELSASMASFSFSFLPLFVLWYNRKHLPEFAQPSWWQTGLVITCSVFYAVMTVVYLSLSFF